MEKLSRASTPKAACGGFLRKRNACGAGPAHCRSPTSRPLPPVPAVPPPPLPPVTPRLQQLTSARSRWRLARGSPITDLCPGEIKELSDNGDIVPGFLCPGGGREPVLQSDSPVSPHLAVHEPDDGGLMPQTSARREVLVGVNCDSFWLVLKPETIRKPSQASLATGIVAGLSATGDGQWQNWEADARFGSRGWEPCSAMQAAQLQGQDPFPCK
ncbi:uncharacterized protein LOC134558328 isoform X2 [Prinia subflava]|uniref:uncharacterized protein LOC134558328 isoform X2 n=1 Tax=Prinia subflava TaxID=208062 RepID=UPI002FE07256